MSTTGARVIAWIAVAVLAIGALRIIRPLPERRPAKVLDDALRRVVWHERVDSLGRGETLSKLFTRSGLSGEEAWAALRSAQSLDARRVPAGMRVTFGGPPDSTPRAVTLHLSVDRRLHLAQTDSGWTSREEVLPWTVDTVVVTGTILTSLYDALDDAAKELPPTTRTALAWDVADIFEYRYDMSRDLQQGDAFSVLVERKRGPEGAVRVGRVLAAALESGGKMTRTFRHETPGNRTRYYDEEGKSMEATFLRAPLQFRRISSVFGMRKHPILGVWRRHAGTDYAAASGTPVRAIGDGVVSFAGRKGGYGNTIEIRHANGMVSRYGHLRGFAKGARRGARVSMGETVGYVGATGLATAPHLHFETLVGGVQRNPRTVLNLKSGAPLPASERERFESTRALYSALMSQEPARLAGADVSGAR